MDIIYPEPTKVLGQYIDDEEAHLIYYDDGGCAYVDDDGYITYFDADGDVIEKPHGNPIQTPPRL